ncbi:MAG: metalloprotease [Bacteroidetes bacterium]|nr:metalloprotease [Bacteroidota bacterium]
MRWQGREGSRNVEDRRGSKGKMAAGGLGIGGIIIAVVVMLLGGDPSALLQQLSQAPVAAEASAPPSAAEEELAAFVSVVLRETEVTWSRIFQEQVGQAYREPVLVLYTSQVQSACGAAGASTGPFYCPGDEKLYIDLSFYDDLKQRFGAPGDFAMAYVVAHEVAHHVQNLLGLTDQVDAQRGRVSKEQYNELSVRLELQADYFAGVWARDAQGKNLLDPGDLEEALRCAQAIGDDRLQMQAQGYIVPESFTHGTSEQRKRWFSKGFQSGRIADGDTFGARVL